MSLDAATTTALIISLVALVIALGQLLAQTLGTVEGHRRCQRSVMGEWSKYTRRRWRWSQFRFETLFTTPEIVLAPCHTRDQVTFPIHGDDISGSRTFVPRKLKSMADNTHEIVCWVPLLVELYDNAEPVRETLFKASHFDDPNAPKYSWPAIRKMERSWDFMPPEIVRPFATTTVSEITILACRLGVIWKDFRPTEGIMEGQGGGHVFSAMRVRGIGIMLSYTRLATEKYEGDDHFEKGTPCQRFDGRGSLRSMHLQAGRASDEEKANPQPSELSNKIAEDSTQRFVWTAEADKFWFGILPGNPQLGLPDFRVGTMEDIFNTLWLIDPEGVAVRHLENMQKKQKDYLHGFCDIIPMVAPWLRQPNSRFNWYPKLHKSTPGLMWYQAGYVVFKEQLDKYNSDEAKATSWTRKIAAYYKDLHDNWPKDWDGISDDLQKRGEKYYNVLENYYKETTEYFMGTRSKPEEGENADAYAWKREWYMDLVCAHLREAPRSYPDADDKVSTQGCRDRFGDKQWRGEAMRFYWRYIPDYVRYMKKTGKCDNNQLVTEAWIVLIFRAFLWTRAHIPMDHGRVLPSQYYGSRLPIYIS